MATKVSYDYGGKRINSTQEFILNAGETPEAIEELCSIGSTAYRPIDGKKWMFTDNGWTLIPVSNGGGSIAGGVEQSYVDEADAKVLAESKQYSDEADDLVFTASKQYSDIVATQSKNYADTQDVVLEAEIREVINNLPTHTLFGGGEEYKHFGIGLIDRNGPSLIEYVLSLKEKGLYTVYCDEGIKDNPISPVSTSAFRGLCHLTNLENENKTKLAYGWVILFDQEGHAYVNYIRRSVASGWVRQDALDEEAIKLANTYTDEMIAKLPTHTMFGKGGEHFGIRLTDANGPTLIEHVLGLTEAGLYTVYCDDPVPGNPKSSVPTSAFRGLCHLTQIRDDSKNQLPYGWILLFDQVGHAYTSYIWRGNASEWKDLAKEPEIELIVDADGRLVSGTCNGKAIKITVQ